MNAEEFIESVHAYVYQSAIRGTLKVIADPPGRKPRRDLVDLSTWFNDLDEKDKRFVGDVVRLATYGAIFDVLAVLDGVRVIDDQHTEFTLTTDAGTRLNGEGELHALFQITVDHALGHVDEKGNSLPSGQQDN